jgi:hypothetical protein
VTERKGERKMVMEGHCHISVRTVTVNEGEYLYCEKEIKIYIYCTFEKDETQKR